MSDYRHPCGKIEPEASLTIGFDPRFASGPCGCGKRDPWVLVPDRAAIEEAGKIRGMAVASAATPDWQDDARRWVRSQPSGTTLISDDVTRAVGVPPSQGAVGALFNALATSGVIVQDGYTKSRREGRHASMVRVWRRR